MKDISVMIVDDEKLAIEDLTTIVDWEALGFKIVATAVNGRQALSKFQYYRPQIVFTDIKMPFMDGIELIKHLREIDDKVNILLLTAYEDFSYAKSAIKYGITDYIIKYEIDNQTFTNLLLKLRSTIETQNRNNNILNDKIITDFFYSHKKNYIYSNEELFSTPYCYLFVEQDLPVNLTADINIQNIRYKKSDMISALKVEESNKYKVVAMGSTPNDQVVLVINISQIYQSLINQDLLKYATDIKLRLEEQLQCAFTVYVVSNKMNMIELKKNYILNNQIFKLKYLTGCSTICNYGDRNVIKYEGNTNLNIKLLEKLLDKIDGQGVQNYLDELFSKICLYGDYRFLCEACRDMYGVLERNIKALPESENKPNISTAANWRYWLDANRLHNWFSLQFELLVKTKEKIRLQCYSKPIIRAIDFVHNNYADNHMSLSNIAEYVHLSTGHLCSLFKKDTGTTLKSYITEVRIAEAKRLLDEGSLKIYEISSAVGYQSSQYFSQVFYKQVGIHPTKYQKGMKVKVTDYLEQ